MPGRKRYPRNNDFLFDRRNLVLAKRQMTLARSEGESFEVKERPKADVGQEMMLAQTFGLNCEDCAYTDECKEEGVCLLTGSAS